MALFKNLEHRLIIIYIFIYFSLVYYVVSVCLFFNSLISLIYFDLFVVFVFIFFLAKCDFFDINYLGICKNPFFFKKLNEL